MTLYELRLDEVRERHWDLLLKRVCWTVGISNDTTPTYGLASELGSFQLRGGLELERS